MKQRQTSQSYARVGFTLIELLVVIAIIAILAAILFPVFAAVREQSRQSSTMSNMHSMYVGAKTFNEDEGSFPTALLGYAEVVVPFVDPPQNRPATAEDVDIVPMDQARGSYLLANGTGVGHLYREQVKDYITFTSPANREKNLSKVTQVYYPRGLWPIIDPSAPLTLNENKKVVWEGEPSAADKLNGYVGDTDIPNDSYVGKPKLFYVMDSMDIGPMLNDNGTLYLDGSGLPVYELHYALDWTHKIGAEHDLDLDNKPIVTQLKYKNPPSERTILTYVTHHAAFNNSSYTLLLLLSGTARKGDAKSLTPKLPLSYTR